MKTNIQERLYTGFKNWQSIIEIFPVVSHKDCLSKFPKKKIIQSLFSIMKSIINQQQIHNKDKAYVLYLKYISKILIYRVYQIQKSKLFNYTQKCYDYKLTTVECFQTYNWGEII